MTSHASSAKHANWVASALSALGIVLGLITLVGWHVQWPEITHWAQGTTPMFYNTAISFVVLGAALLAISLGRRRLSAVLAVLGALPGFLTLVEYGANVSLGIDQLLMKVETASAYPGRIAPNTAICLVLIAGAVLCMASGAKSRTRTLGSPLLASVALGLSAVALAGYLTGYATFGWGHLIPMALPTSVGLTLLSLSALSVNWRDRDLSYARVPSWLYITVGVTAMVMTVSLWQALAAEEETRIQHAVTSQLEVLRVNLQDDMGSRIAMVARFGRRWERASTPDRQQWEFETSLLLKDVQGFTAIGWADAEFHMQWIHPPEGNEPLQGFDLGSDPSRRVALERARDLRRTSITRPMQLLAGGEGINAYAPVYRDSVLQGFVVAGFRFQDLFPHAVDSTLAPGYAVAIYDGDRRIYFHAPPDGQRGRIWQQQTLLQIENTVWTLELWPTPAALTRVQSAASSLVLGAGLLLSVLLGWAVFLLQAAREKTWLAEHARAQLEKEVAERRRIEQELDQFFTVSPDMLCIAGFDGYFKRLNPAWTTVLGWQAEQLMETPFVNFVHPEDIQATFDIVKQQEAGASVLLFENRYRAQDGSYHWMQWSSRPNSELQLIFAAARDVTAQKQAEAAREESELAFRGLADAVPQIVWICTPDGLNVYFNQRWVDYSGLTLEESYGRGWNTPFHPDDKQAAWDSWNQATATGRLYCIESRLRAFDGSYRWFLMRGTPVRDEAGDVLKWFGTCTDIHDMKEAQDTLRRVNQELGQASAYNRSLIEASLDPLVTIASDGKITDVNQATEKITGRSRDALIGTDFCDYFTDPARARAGYQRVFEDGRTQDYELELRHRDGSTRPVLYNASVYCNQAGETMGVFAAARDITERKRVEDELKELNASLERRVAERTSDLLAVNQELESFNYSVSHDLRAPLRHIDGFSKILMADYGGALLDDGRRCVDHIREGARRMGRMVDELLELSRTSRRDVSKQLTGVKAVVAEVIQELKPDTEDREIEWRIGELPFAYCDPTLTRQVFVNLLNNAVKFTRDRKPAVIEVGQIASPGETVLYVRDNGVGFNIKYADKLFGVFQRLHRREDFEGTGVGLATVQRIVQKHGGRIWAEAELEKGATFFFTLEPAGQRHMEEPELATVLAGNKS